MFLYLIGRYTEPVPIPVGDLKREAGDSRTKQRSQIHPQEPKVDPSVENPKSGFDAIVWFEISNETAFKRSLGRRIDSLTRAEYHLEDNSPPLNQPVTIL